MKKFLFGLATAILLGLVGCSSSDQASEASDSMTLENVRYECGPYDAAVVSFRASATTAIAGTAELVVDSETYGSIKVALGPAPSDYTMDIDLTQAAFAIGRGFVRITSGGGGVEASAPVVLRLEPGISCG